MKSCSGRAISFSQARRRKRERRGEETDFKRSIEATEANERNEWLVLTTCKACDGHRPSTKFAVTSEPRTAVETRERSRRGRADAAGGARVILLLADGETYATITAKDRLQFADDRVVEAALRGGRRRGTDRSAPWLDAHGADPQLQARILAGAETQRAAHDRRPRVARCRPPAPSPGALHALDRIDPLLPSSPGRAE
jgi:hypothetical protein